MTSRLPTETFRVRPWPRRRGFFVVHLAETLAAMKAEMRCCGCRPHPRQGACCVSATAQGAYRHLLGFIFLARTHYGVGLVAHELAHAAFRACESDGLRVDHWVRHARSHQAQASHAEEQYATIVEHLNRHFWQQMYRHGLT